jgi:hypothetical protein
MTAETIQRAERNLQRMLEWIGRHDARSAGTLGVTLAMMGALSASLPPLSRWPAHLLPVVLLTSAGSAFVLFHLLRSQFPRIHAHRPSICFFGTISRMEHDDYRRRFSTLDDEGYLNDLLSQCHVNASILTVKFTCLKRALIALLFTALPWALAIGMGRSAF